MLLVRQCAGLQSQPNLVGTISMNLDMLSQDK